MKSGTKVLSVDAFRAKVLQDVEELCEANGWKFHDEQGRGFAFQRWTANLLCAHEGIQASAAR
jgi:hypothetical protein